MTEYTIGIYFNRLLTHVCLIKKKRPDWQAGLYNFPGGKLEPNETSQECIKREFKEECCVDTAKADWTYCGIIYNTKLDYKVHVYAIASDDVPTTGEDQKVKWFSINRLPTLMIPNVQWLTYVAIDFLKKDAVFDKLSYITIKYE